MLAACASVSDRNRDTIATLRHVQIEIKEEKIEGGLEKAMLSYQRFLEDTPDSALTPEAIRRLADLKIQKEYGTLTTGAADRRAGAGIARPGTRDASEGRSGRRRTAGAGIGAYSGPRRVRGGL